VSSITNREQSILDTPDCYQREGHGPGVPMREHTRLTWRRQELVALKPVALWERFIWRPRRKDFKPNSYGACVSDTPLHTMQSENLKPRGANTLLVENLANAAPIPGWGQGQILEPKCLSIH
jgi:hypothetical protein